ncbi:MAG: hypothetical protein C0407_11945 [Desulfobacca sp.]|nr:hypothetical protein [Desulfobacca sp.]
MSGRMDKILMVGPHSDRVKGGVSSCVRNILSSELIKDYPITYIASKVDGPNFIKLGVAIQALFIFLWKICTTRVALVHIQGSHYASFYRKMIFILLAKMGRKKVLFHCHGSRFDQFYQDGPDWQKLLIRKILSLCDLVVALSPSWKAFFEEFLEASSVRMLENAIPLRTYQLPKDQEKPFSQGPIILFAGEVGERKGAYDLLAIIPELVLQVPQVTIQLAGNGDLDKIQAVAKRLKIEDHMQLKGWVSAEKMIGLYYQADLFVLPSYHEGLPVAILEAMACGLPVVSTRVGGIPELICDGENGLLINPGDRKALLGALSSLLGNPVLRQEMALKNVQKIKEKYDIPNYIEKLKSLYQEILGEK